MHKVHRQNHDFQILHFIAGSCHTPDGAWSALIAQRDGRLEAIQNYEVSLLRTAAKKLRAEEKLKAENPADRLEAQADLQEIENNHKTCQVLFDAAKDELTYIDELIAKLEPLRKFKKLTPAEAHEAGQREEWRLELMFRAENFLLTTGSIPPDHFATMRQHPDFEEVLLPWVVQIRQAMKDNAPERFLLKRGAVLRCLTEGQKEND